MYGTSFLLKEINGTNALGAPAEKYQPTYDEINEIMLKKFEEQAVSGYTLVQENGKWVMGESFDKGGTGWHFDYNTKRGSAYMYNDDTNSPYYKWFISYENELSLQEKLDYINDAELAGIIVWESSQDTKGHSFITQMADNLMK
jgi:chitinase